MEGDDDDNTGRSLLGLMFATFAFCAGIWVANLDRPHASVKGTIDVTVSCRGELPVTCKQIIDGSKVGILSVMERP